MNKIEKDARKIISESIGGVLPDKAVEKALENFSWEGKLVVLAIGKAAWKMAQAANEILNGKIDAGLIITKYGHSEGEIPGFHIVEAGHPVLDENSIIAGEEGLQLIRHLSHKDRVLVLLSGGGSSLFEKPLDGVTLEDLAYMSEALLAQGATITEFNAIRKHLSAVKGGRFAEACLPARVFTVILSDVLGDRLDTIASGPTCGDETTVADALNIVRKYGLKPSEPVLNALKLETPKTIFNNEVVITGNVTELCKMAEKTARTLGYEPWILSTSLEGEAGDAGEKFASLTRNIAEEGKPLKPPCAIIAGGETVVIVRGKGKGGRNQQMALTVAEGIGGLEDVLFFSVGSDGTDGPTDAAGGIVTGETKSLLEREGIRIKDFLENNDAYNALKLCDGLIFTGPTGTNVNDLQVLLIGRKDKDEMGI